MSNVEDKYRLGVGNTVLELFKKVLRKKQRIAKITKTSTRITSTI